MHGTFVVVEAGADLPEGIWNCSVPTKITAVTKLLVLSGGEGYDIRAFDPNDSSNSLVLITPEAPRGIVAEIDGRGKVSIWVNYWVGRATSRLEALRDVVAADRPRKSAKDALARLR